MAHADADAVRLDRWLFAARFFKSRSLATTAIEGGHVRIEGARVKPGRKVGVGETITVAKGDVRFVVVVRALAQKRGPARVAVSLYEETAESRATREAAATERKIMHRARPIPSGRPTKHDRRHSRELSGKE